RQLEGELVGVRVPAHAALLDPALHAQRLAHQPVAARDELTQLEVVHRGGADAGVDQVGDGGRDQRGPHDEAASIQHASTRASGARESPRMMTSRPIRPCWCTTQLPEMKAWSSTTTCPPSVAPVAMMTPFPSLQLWPTCACDMR